MDVRNDSYQEMKALLNERLDSIVGTREDEEQESGLKKWGKRAAVGALAAGGIVGAAYGGSKALKYAASKSPRVRSVVQAAQSKASQMRWRAGGMRRQAASRVGAVRRNVTNRINNKQMNIPGL